MCRAARRQSSHRARGRAVEAAAQGGAGSESRWPQAAKKQMQVAGSPLLLLPQVDRRRVVVCRRPQGGQSVGVRYWMHILRRQVKVPVNTILIWRREMERGCQGAQGLVVSYTQKRRFWKNTAEIVDGPKKTCRGIDIVFYILGM